MKLSLKLTSAEIRSLPIICIETGEKFNNGNLAEQIISKRQGLKHCHIYEALKDSTKTAGGYHWKYIEEEEDD